VIVTADQITQSIPSCSLGWAVELAAAMPNWQIDSIVRAEMFLAQCAHESAGFTRTVENLNYSVTGLMNTWPSHFPNVDIASRYAHQDQKIANHVYANRMGNGSAWLLYGNLLAIRPRRHPIERHSMLRYGWTLILAFIVLAGINISCFIPDE